MGNHGKHKTGISGAQKGGGSKKHEISNCDTGMARYGVSEGLERKKQVGRWEFNKLQLINLWEFDPLKSSDFHQKCRFSL